MTLNTEIEHKPSEHAPLLSSSIHNVDSLTESTEVLRKKPSRLFIITLLLLFVVLIDLGYELIVPAQTRVVEAIYCREYYEKQNSSLIGSDGRDGVDEKWCKVGMIQGEVAMLKGWQVTLDSIEMLVFSVPWGYFADSYGRKPVILLLTIALWIKYAFVQLIISFAGTIPLRLSWISAVHTVFGGSVSICTALIYTIISDIIPEGERVAIFFQVVAANFTTQFLGPLLCAALMSWNPCFPMILGLAVEGMGVALIVFIPETLHHSESPSLNSIYLSVQSTTSVKPVWTWRDLALPHHF